MYLKYIYWTMIVCVMFMACAKERVNWVSENNVLYKDYIAGYSPGQLERGSGFAIEFTKAMVRPEDVGKEWSQAKYTLNPDLKGSFYWVSASRIEFRAQNRSFIPEHPFTLSVDLKGLFPEIRDDIRWAGFRFHYVPLSVQVKWGVPRVDLNDPSKMFIMAKIRVNEKMEPDALRKMVKVDGSKTAAFTMDVHPSENEPDLFELVIGNIQKMDQAFDLVLSLQWPDGFKTTEFTKETIRIPSKHEFTITGMERSESEASAFHIYFSALLDPAQEIQGLVQVDTAQNAPSLNKDRDGIQVDLSDVLFPQTGNIKVLKLLRSSTGEELAADQLLPYSLEEQKPFIRFVSNGTVLPYSDQVIMPFEAINLKSIDVEIFKIFKNNVLYDMHLNFSSQDDSYQLVRLGRVVNQQTIQLDQLSPGSNRNSWKRYGLDLSKLIESEPGAMYQLRLSFRPSYTEYYCAQGLPNVPDEFFSEDSGNPVFKSTWRDYAYYDYEAGYDYGSADDPCSLSYYYSEHFAKRTLYASNIGIAVKSAGNDGSCYAFAYDLQSGRPIQNVNIKLYDRQLQLLHEGLTDNAGVFQTQLTGQVMFATAEWNRQIAYLELEPGKSISQSEFETDGVLSKDGLKISTYTERGVWRPGDTVHFNVILFGGNEGRPTFPIQLSVTNPRGKIIYQSTITENMMGLYSFKIPIAINDVTGTYIAKVQAGPLEIHKNLQIETIKPNNIRINWELKETMTYKAMKADWKMQALWLHGQEAPGLKTQIKFKYKLVEPSFEKYKEYAFVDPETPSLDGELEIFNGSLDEHGEFNTKGMELPLEQKTGDVKGNLISMVTESSGVLNTDYYPLNVKMFDEYAGIRIPDGPYGYKSLERGKNQDVKIVVVNSAGLALSGRTVLVELFKVSHEWWYEMRTGFPGYYQASNFKTKIKSEKLTTDRNGLAFFNIKLDDYDRYYIKVTNQNNQYLTGDYFYTGWPSDDQAKNFVNILHFKADKDVYQIGDQAQLTLPGAATGAYTINIIKGNKIIKSDLIPARTGHTEYQVKLESGMAPNVYVDVSYIQACKNKLNDVPLRLFGIIPLRIEDPEKKLLPKLVMPEIFKPNEEFVVEVSEEKSKECAYQLYVVDEGLLNLTRFKTPQPYDDLMAKEALALMTWDNFDAVIGNLDGEFERIFSIGGDGALNNKELNKVKRFKPVIIASGPHRLEKGKKNKHAFKLENYTGAVRVMVIANNDNAGGAAEKSVPVKKELMAQLALPRVLTYKDQLSIPVTVITTTPALKTVRLTLNLEGPVKLLDPPTKVIQFKREGEQIAFFNVASTGNIGGAKFKVTAEANGIKAQHELEVKIENPNQLTQRHSGFWVESGKNIQPEIQTYGMEGTQKMEIEVSTLKGLSMKYLTDRLIQYPHGCLEQTLSALFPQSLLHKLMELNQADKLKINSNIAIGIDKLRRFQQPSGGFSYWPGMLDVSDWNTSYAGHFLIVARNAGFYIPGDIVDKWYKYQASTLNSIESKDLQTHPWKQKALAYKLFTMALYGKPSYAAMNVLHQLKNRNLLATAFLAAAFHLSGKQDMAQKLLPAEAPVFSTYREYDESFGSNFRDEAACAQIFSLIGRKQEAFQLLSKILNAEKSIDYLNTQELSFVMQAVAELYGQQLKQPIEFEFKWNGKRETVRLNSNYYVIELPPVKNGEMHFNNLSKIPLALNIIQSGIEPLQENVKEMKGIHLSSQLHNVTGSGKILKPGDQLEVTIDVRLTNYSGVMNNMALIVNFPSTFEVINERIGGNYALPDGVSFQDFRDNQVKTYFDLQSGKILKLKFPIQVTFAGKFATPLIICESMYDPSVYARISTPAFEIQNQ